MTIIAGLARLANHFRADRPSDAWQMLFEDYSDDLMGVSEGHLQTILTKQRQDSPWFPKSADLVAAWDAIRLRESEQLRRARVLLGLEAPKPWERMS